MKEPNELSSNIQKVLMSKDKKQIKKLLEDYKNADIAEAMEDLDDNKLVLNIFKILTNDEKSNLLTYLNPELQEYIVENISKTELGDIVNDIYSDDLVDIIDELPKESVQKILDTTTSEKRKELNEILKYDEETAGGIMSVNFIKFKQTDSISNAIKKIRTKHDDFETVDDLFVTNDFGHLIGEIKLKDLVVNDGKKKLAEIMDTSVIAVPINEDQEEVVKQFKKYDINTLPVIDASGKMVGIITSDDIMDVIEKEQTEDIQKMAGITPLDDDDPFKTSIWKMVLSRSIWLIVGILLATITQILIVVFLNKYGANTIEKGTMSYSAIYLLVPMILVIASVCGISVNQSTTSMVRVLSLKEYDKKEILKVMAKEMITSVVLAALVVIVNLVRLIIFYEAEFGTLNNNAWYAIASSSIAILIGIIFAGLIGSLLPLAANKFKLDPALVSSPFTAGLIDITTVAIFFGIGIAFFG